MSRLVIFTANINFEELDERIQQILHYDGEQRRREETIELLEEISKETTEDCAIHAIGLSVDMMMLSDWATMYIMLKIWSVPIKGIHELTKDERVLFDTSDRGISYYRYPIDPDKVNALIDKAKKST